MGNYRFKKILCFLLALVLALSLLPGVLADESGMSNFKRSKTYTAGQFKDVASDAWYASGVKNAYELGLMSGSSNAQFNPNGEITIRETVTIAAIIHSTYYGETIPDASGPWYQKYINYAIDKGIIKSSTDTSAIAKRYMFAYILAKALPSWALPAINDIDSIPDVSSSDWFSSYVLLLYNAGVLTGSDEYGTFHPNTTIKRSAVATIVAKMADASLRTKTELTLPEVYSASQIKTVTRNGVKCYQVGGVCYPAVFGTPKLTDEKIAELLAEGDPVKMAWAVKTVPDCLRLLKERQKSSENIANSDAETTLLHGGTQPKGWVEAMLYLLADDYDEAGCILLTAPNNGFYFAAIKTDGKYYALDPFDILSSSWFSFSGEGFAAADVKSVISALVKNCDYSKFTSGTYEESGYQLPDKDDWTRRKAFKEREYTDAQIQKMVAANLTLEEAADKLHTVEDAAVFLQASGYHFDYSYNQGCDVGSIHWAWVLPADFTYEKMAGSCGGSANLMNRLLAGDYDEQGYIEYLGGHIFNYIKQDGYYYFCDFINSKYLSSANHTSDYLIYVCKDPLDFTDYYCSNVMTGWDDPENEDAYLVHMYLYPRDGLNALALGSTGAYNNLTQGRQFDAINAEIKDTMIDLYLRDGYEVQYVEFDSDANRPPVVNIPDDAHFNWRTGEITE